MTALFTCDFSQKTVIVSDTEPRASVNTLWLDTSTSPPVLKLYPNAATGWVAVGGSGVGGSTFEGTAYSDVLAGSNITFQDNGDGTVTLNVSGGTATVGDGSYGDITVSNNGATWKVSPDAHFVAFPATPNAAGQQGQMAFNPATGTLAICVATNTWRYIITAASSF